MPNDQPNGDTKFSKPSINNNNGFNNVNSNGSSRTEYPSSIFQKSTGTLVLNDQSLSFTPNTLNSNNNNNNITLLWNTVQKHQVSPVSHPKPLLKIIFTSTSSSSGTSSTSYTFQLPTRIELDRIRQDISQRLALLRQISYHNHDSTSSETNTKKRSFNDVSSDSNNLGMSPPMTKQSNQFSILENLAARSSLLSSSKSLKTQHSLLVQPLSTTTNVTTTTPTTINSNDTTSPLLSENDFWSSSHHQLKIHTQTAKINGILTKGLPSQIKSSLQINKSSIRIGVEEMKQIFILYPAVHKAYEEKVPLELSEEQFWRKYLESEYFFRDRGRLGDVSKLSKDLIAISGSTSNAAADGTSGFSGIMGDKEEAINNHKDPSVGGKEDDNQNIQEQEEKARVAAASSNDIFSRMELKLEKDKKITSTAISSTTAIAKDRNSSSNTGITSVLENRLALGQFDLSSTANTERGLKLLFNSTDLHPNNPKGSQSSASGRLGSKVIEKYNRHWALVLNPEEATAGCDLKALARTSVKHSYEGSDDAKVSGGVGREMARLVNYANSMDDIGDNVKDTADFFEKDGMMYKELKLRDENVYSGVRSDSTSVTLDQRKQVAQRDAAFSKLAFDQVKKIVIDNYETNEGASIKNAFPQAKFGRELLMALTKRMVLDSMTEADEAKLKNQLDDSFLKQLTAYFRRSSELLRHFFALRAIIESSTHRGQGSNESKQKLKKIVMGMEAVYRKIEGMRKDLPATEKGEIMRKMCVPIMEQLDWAFKLHRDGSGGGGGFVNVED